MSGRKGIMLCYPFEESRLAKWEPPYIVQPKLDGERCRYEWYEGGSLLLSSQENVFFGVPHIKRFLEDHNVKLKLDGELYRHGLSFDDISSIVSREVNIHPNHNLMQYHVFDICEPLMNQVERNKALKELEESLPSNDIIKFVPSFIAYSLDDVMRHYDQILNAGYEGIIVRNIFNNYTPKRSTLMMKFKPKKSDEYTIIGYTEEISIDGIPKNSLGAFICSGDDGTSFNVGSGFTREQRENYWNDKELFIGKTCVVEYQHTTSGRGVPRFPIFVRVI